MDDPYTTRERQRMTPRSPQSGIPPVLRKPPIAEELDKLRELPPRTTNREPLSRLERLAILNGLRGGLSTSRIATQWSMSDKTVQRLKGRIYAEPLSFYSMTRRYTTYNPLLPFLSAPFSTPISNSRCCPSPSQALPRPTRINLSATLSPVSV